MTTKERAIAAVAALRDRYVSHHAPPALNEELVDAVLEAIRELDVEMTRRLVAGARTPEDAGSRIIAYEHIIDDIKDNL